MNDTDVRNYFFISGLPRSGSTLLAAILRQNPKIEAGMTSPVGNITGSVRTIMSSNAEISALVTDKDRKNILNGIMRSYYQDLPEDVTVFDTNRSWTARVPELVEVMGSDIKIIAMVRNPAWIFDSVERIIAKSPLKQSSLSAPGSTIQARAQHMFSETGLIGQPMGHLQGALASPSSRNIMLVDYDALCADPKTALAAIYKFSGLKPYEHDFSKVEYEQYAFDDAVKTPGLHSVTGAVEAIDRKTVLPPEMFNNLSKLVFWMGEDKSMAAKVIMSTEN